LRTNRPVRNTRSGWGVKIFGLFLLEEQQLVTEDLEASDRWASAGTLASGISAASTQIAVRR
jgi:hypothetical protein